MEAEDLKARVRGLKEVSTIPIIHQKVLQVLENEWATTGDMEEVIEHDQSIASRILGMANAAFYGQSRKVNTISQAIYILGLDMVKAIALSVTVFDLLRFRHMDLRHLWVHSFKVAMASLLIGEGMGMKGEPLFVSGLIHDIGRAVMCQILGSEYEKVWGLKGEDLLKGEEEAFGAPHTTVGGWFVEGYLFPGELVRSVELHHSPEDMPVVCIADSLVSLDDPGGDGISLTPEALERSGIGEEVVEKAGSTLKEMEGDIKEFYGLL